MSRTCRAAFLAPIAFVLIAVSCTKKKPIDYSAELAPGEMALRKIPPSEYPDFSQCTWNLNVLGRSIDQSIVYMAHPSSRRYYPYLDISHDRAVATLRAFRAIVNEAGKRGSDAGVYIDQQIRQNFEVYKSKGAPRPEGGGYTDIVLFTGYCCPNREASLTRTGPYQWPLYKRPADLATDPVTGETIGRKTPDGKIVPYWTRQEIESGKLAGHEFVWLKSRWEAYVVTVQGSARLRLTDGRILEVGFAGHNGHEYTSPGRQMVADGLIAARDLNLRSLSAYFAAHPEAMDKYLWLNKRTVFFTERPGGPYGSLNVPVTTMATIATDKSVYPRAMPAFLSVPVPRSDNPAEKWHFRGFMLDQDTGGAIRAAGRCDIFMGIGDEAEALAGHQLSEGELYYIALKPELVQRYLPAPTTRPATTAAAHGGAAGWAVVGSKG